MSTTVDFSFSDKNAVPGKDLLSEMDTGHRSVWLRSQIAEGDLFFFQDGQLSRLLFREVLSCFECGHFGAVVVLGFSFIERSLAGRLLSQTRRDPSNSSSEELLRFAFERGWFSAEEFNHLNKLRQVRNRLVHFKEPLHEKRLEHRAALAGKSPEEVLESDASAVLSAAIRVLSDTAI